MSQDALDLIKQQMEDYYDLHPESVEVSILDGKGGTVIDSIQGIFDNPVMSEDARQMGAVERNKRMVRVTFYSGHSSKFTARTTWILVNGVEWKVRDIEADKTQGDMQAILWLV